jgi:phage gp45-like
MHSARATIREIDDDHLMQEVKQADVYHSESPTSFERWQAVGMTAVPIKQQADPNQKDKQPGKDETGDWGHNQPTGPAAEAVMLYLNGSRSHPVAMVDDRRVRPYGMQEGEGAHYAPDGSEQMVLFKETGTYVTSLDGTSVKDNQTKKTRFASLRHVNKKMQTHKIDSSSQSQQSSSSGPQAQQRDGSTTTTGGSQQQQPYKHEGDSVNTEVRCSAGKVEIYTGTTQVGVYDVASNTWTLKDKNDQYEIVNDGSKIVCRHQQDNTKSLRIDGTHAHIRFGSNAIWCDAGGCHSSAAITIAPDTCS